jgi:hypothetical protein
MENEVEFVKWLDKCLADAQDKLKICDSTIAFVLLQRGIGFYYRDLLSRKIT